MIPLTVTREELLAGPRLGRGRHRGGGRAPTHKGLDVTIGTMIETPRAALRADEIAEVADFFSFGTNDLTQMTFGFSRDDVEGRMMPAYLEQGLLRRNPFETIDQDGVGELVAHGRRAGPRDQARRSSSACAASTAAIPESIDLFYRVGPRLRVAARRSGCRSPGWPRRRPSWARPHLTPARSPKDHRARHLTSTTSLLASESQRRRTSPTSTSSRGCGSAFLALIIDAAARRPAARPPRRARHHAPRKRPSRRPSGSRSACRSRFVIWGGVGRPGGRRVHLRLPDREEPLGRQRLRVGGHHELLRRAAGVPVPRAVLGRVRRAGAPVRLHLRRRRRCSTGSSGCCSCSAASSSSPRSGCSGTTTRRSTPRTTRC